MSDEQFLAFTTSSPYFLFADDSEEKVLATARAALRFYGKSVGGVSVLPRPSPSDVLVMTARLARRSGDELFTRVVDITEAMIASEEGRGTAQQPRLFRALETYVESKEAANLLQQKFVRKALDDE